MVWFLDLSVKYALIITNLREFFHFLMVLLLALYFCGTFFFFLIHHISAAAASSLATGVLTWLLGHYNSLSVMHICQVSWMLYLTVFGSSVGNATICRESMLWTRIYCCWKSSSGKILPTELTWRVEGAVILGRLSKCVSNVNVYLCAVGF